MFKALDLWEVLGDDGASIDLSLRSYKGGCYVSRYDTAAKVPSKFDDHIVTDVHFEFEPSGERLIHVWVQEATLSAAEAAEILGVTRQRVYRMEKDGVLQGARVNGRVYFTPEEVQRRKRAQEGIAEYYENFVL